MALFAITLAGVSAGDKSRIQDCFFPLLESDTITVATDVDDAALKTHFDNLVDERVRSKEKKTHTSTFSYTAPVL